MVKKVRRTLWPENGFLRGYRHIIHVGANEGQERELYATYDLNIHRMELIPEVFERLQAVRCCWHFDLLLCGYVPFFLMPNFDKRSLKNFPRHQRQSVGHNCRKNRNSGARQCSDLRTCLQENEVEK